jgi:hypothetical protein
VSAARRPRWAVLGAISAVVVALHALALLVVGPAWLDPEEAPAAVLRLQVRSVAAEAPTPAPRLAAVEAMATPVLKATRGELPPAVRGEPPPGRPRAGDAALPLPTVDAAAEPAVEPVSSAVQVPVYATQLAPAGRWHYRLQRGLMVGEAELDWAPVEGAGYSLQLQGRVAGVSLIDWVSRGQIDAAGIAPDRFAVRRRGRDSQAANFQREPGKVTFSGPTHELPLLPGAQDRLSWMLQLPAIIAAAPERFGSGASIQLFVAGARGSGDVWTFVVQDSEAIGQTPALKLVREPRQLYDTRIEVWLDPAEHFMPLRTVQTPTGGGAATELLRVPR